jgi:M6 family metalloprotease-like protein
MGSASGLVVGRNLIAVVCAALMAGLAPFAASASSDTAGSALDYDIDRVRAVQEAAASLVGPPPRDVAEYFADKPAFFAHPQHPELVGQGPEASYLELEEYAAMREQLRAYLATKHQTIAAAAAAADEPVVFKIPAILFRVHDDEWQEDSTPEKFSEQLSGIGTSPTGTVTEMYLEQSFGNMIIEIDVYGPYDSVLANGPQNEAGVCYYGTEGAPLTGDVLGLGGLGARGMAIESVPMATPDIDFGQYDNTLDGQVDFLLMIHSGPGAESTGDPCHVWSHYFGPIAGEPTIATGDTNANGDPVVVGAVMTVPEVDLQIGVTAHEIMHALGEPDYYGTAGTSGTGDWDLGAGGSWAGIPAQTNPVHFNPVMKMNFQWVKPRIVTDTTLDVELLPRASHPDMVMIPLRIAKADSDEAALCDQQPIDVPGQNNAFYTDDGDCLVEGFLLENMSRASAAWNECTFTPARFDRQLYGSGLGVWHWDFTTWQQLGNNNILRPMLAIKEFDRRQGIQDLRRNITRGQPLDLFWGDPVGLSGATQIAAESADIAPPDGSPWTVTGVPGAGAAGTEATPIPEWEAADLPDGFGMTVALSWDVATDDWDLYVDRFEDGDWVEVASSAAGAPQTDETVTIFDFAAGDLFRARAYNWLGPTTPQAEVAVTYEGAAMTQLGPVGTRNNDLEQTGWAITNIRPNDYRGLTHASEQPRTPILVDLVRHDDTTVDVSGDFLRVASDDVAPVITGEQTTLVSTVYNHGGKAVAGARFSLYDTDPLLPGAQPLATVERDLEGFGRDEVTFTYTPALGVNELFVRASAPGDVTPGNDIVRTELEAWPANADVLLVDNDYGWTLEEAYEAVLTSLGVSYAVAEGEPSADVLADYDAVIWQTTTVSGGEGVLSEAAQQAIETYLDDGGALWLATTRAAAYADPDWLAAHFGFVPAQNLLDSMGDLIGLDDAVGGTRTVGVGYLDGRPYLDYGTLATEGVKGMATGVFAHAERPDHVVATRVEGDVRAVYGAPLGLLQDAAERVTLVEEVLEFFGIGTGNAAPSDLRVHFERFHHVQVGQDWPVTVGAVAPGGVDGVTMAYRPYGAAAWERIALDQAAIGLWAGAIPGSDIGGGGLEYFVEVTRNGIVEAVDGGARMPHVASAPYGDPVDVDYCPAGATAPIDDDEAAAPLPATGGGLGVIALLVLVGSLVMLVPRRRVSTEIR